MSSLSGSGPGAMRIPEGSHELNADRLADERKTLVFLNAGDRPIQIGSHLHLPDANEWLVFDRGAAAGFRLDVASGTSQRFEPGVSKALAIVSLRGRKLVPGIQIRENGKASSDGRD